MGLFKALESHLKSFSKRTGVQVDLEMPDEPPELSRNAQINLFRVIQEALNNTEKHAKASRVDIAIDIGPQKLCVGVRDDGCGFEGLKSHGRQNNLGIASMRERAELLGGSLEIVSEPGGGTTVNLEVPLGQILEV